MPHGLVDKTWHNFNQNFSVSTYSLLKCIPFINWFKINADRYLLRIKDVCIQSKWICVNWSNMINNWMDINPQIMTMHFFFQLYFSCAFILFYTDSDFSPFILAGTLFLEIKWKHVSAITQHSPRRFDWFQISMETLIISHDFFQLSVWNIEFSRNVFFFFYSD